MVEVIGKAFLSLQLGTEGGERWLRMQPASGSLRAAGKCRHGKRVQFPRCRATVIGDESHPKPRIRLDGGCHRADHGPNATGNQSWEGGGK